MCFRRPVLSATFSISACVSLSRDIDVRQDLDFLDSCSLAVSLRLHFLATTASATGTAARSSSAAGLDDPGNDRWTALDESVEGAWDGSVDGKAEEEWNSTYTLKLPLVPTAFVTHG